MTAGQLRERAELLWPAQIEVYEDFLAGIDQLEAPGSAFDVEQELIGYRNDAIGELERSLAEMDAIFATETSIEVNDEVLRATEAAGTAAIGAAWAAEEPLFELAGEYPGCLPET
jgi:hypothetical protein